MTDGVREAHYWHYTDIVSRNSWSLVCSARVVGTLCICSLYKGVKSQPNRIKRKIDREGRINSRISTRPPSSSNSNPVLPNFPLKPRNRTLHGSNSILIIPPHPPLLLFLSTPTQYATSPTPPSTPESTRTVIGSDAHTTE